MGKKSGRSGDGATKATAFVLKVAMHCRCNGCDDKIRAGVKDLALNHGIEALDQSALWTKGELRVASTAEPDKLRRRLHKATGKKVDLVLPKPDKDAAADKEATAKAAMEALLRRSLQQQQQPAPAQVLPGWGALQQAGGYGYGAAAAAYHPWAVQAQQQPAEAYPSYHPATAYPGAGGAAWGGYAAYPALQGHGAYGGGGWLGHGAY